MRERERYPLHMWEEAVCYLTGAEMQFGDYGKIKAYFIGNTNYAADQF
jgi:phosphoadenosine phosphosulfate reductase